MTSVPFDNSSSFVVRHQELFMSEFEPTYNTAYDLNKDLIKEHGIYSTWKQNCNSK